MNIPLFSVPVKAGFPSPAEDYLEKNLNLNQFLIPRPTATFFVRVDGSSMKDAGIYHDDILIVDKSLEPQNGKIVIAVINGEFTVKKIRLIDEKIYLDPANPQFSPIEIQPDWDFRIWGVVTYVIHKC